MESTLHLVLLLRGGMFHESSGRTVWDRLAAGGQLRVRLCRFNAADGSKVVVAELPAVPASTTSHQHSLLRRSRCCA